MPQKRYKPEQIINKPREAEVELSKGNDIGSTCRKLGFTEQTYTMVGVRNMKKQIISPNSLIRKILFL